MYLSASLLMARKNIESANLSKALYIGTIPLAIIAAYTVKNGSSNSVLFLLELIPRLILRRGAVNAAREAMDAIEIDRTATTRLGIDRYTYVAAEKDTIITMWNIIIALDEKTSGCIDMPASLRFFSILNALINHLPWEEKRRIATASSKLVMLP
jgi:hypothetical protein